MVKGYVVVAGGETRLCEALAESFPPQCAGASLRVEGFDLATREGVQEAGGVSWTDETVSILGDVEDETITFSATSA